jgi:predicted GTPase
MSCRWSTPRRRGLGAACGDRDRRALLMGRRRLLICGAGGRDFHNFNRLYRDAPEIEVVAFTATQIPGIDRRRYPPELAGPRYPDGIPIVPEAELEALCARHGIDQVDCAYSDVDDATVMALAARTLAAGADFHLAGPKDTQLRSRRPVLAISAVRTGCGKSQIARYLSAGLRAAGHRVAVLRHPMPYGDLKRQRLQRFASLADIDAADCTLEEREEYEPHVAAGNLLYAGVDYEAILESAEAEADILLWDGGNNDFPFLAPDLHLVLVDALRPGHIRGWYPGAAVLRTADLVVINKVDAADAAAVEALRASLRGQLPDVPVHRAASPVVLDDPDAVAGRRVLVVDDGPTLTHGGMAWGAGYAAVRALPGVELVDPRAVAAPEIAAVYAQFPHLGPVLPALGYGEPQRAALAATIEASDAEVVVAGTPIDFARAVSVRQPVIRARYAYRSADETPLLDLVQRLAVARRLW